LLRIILKPVEETVYSVKAIYDGHTFKLDTPTAEKCEVITTFMKPIAKTQEDMLRFFGTWDDADVNCMAEIIKERESFSLGRTAI